MGKYTTGESMNIITKEVLLLAISSNQQKAENTGTYSKNVL